jgi:hypothetical protein
MATESGEHDSSLLGRAFDGYQNLMQIARCVQLFAEQTGIDKPRILELSRRELNLSDFLQQPSEVLRYPTHKDNKPALPIPVSLPFADDSFDCCVVTDAYEHVPQEIRRGLLHEMLRVTRGLILLGCPHSNEIVNRFDKIVFDFIWGKYAETFEPLEQHHDFELDRLPEIEALFKSEGASHVAALPCNYVYRWIHMILLHFDLQHRHPHWDLFEPLNRVYNERMSNFDYREPCYRYLMMVTKDPAVDVSQLLERLRQPAEVPEHVRKTDGMLIDAFRTIESKASDRLRRYTDEVEKVHGELKFLRDENRRLLAIIDELQQGNRWALDEIAHLRTRLEANEESGITPEQKHVTI